jgi:hypothetical protein
MGACRTNRERLCLFACLEKTDLGDQFRQVCRLLGPHITFGKAHHFQQTNRRELAR